MSFVANYNLRSLIKYIGFGAVLFFLYKEALLWLVNVDWAREDYSSCGLIPLVVGYLVWEKRKQLMSEPSRPSWYALLPFTAGIFLFWLGELAGEFFTLYLSLWLVTVSLFWFDLGWNKLKIVIFPVLFSLTMFPLPNFINTYLTIKLKLISSQLGVAMLHMMGMTAYREGNMIDLGFTKLQVVDACSGIRFLVPLLIISVLVAYYYKSALWKRLFLVVSAIPISVITNGLRIALVGFLYQFFGAAVAEGFFHDFSGWFIFMFSLGLLLLEVWILSKLFPDKPAKTENTPAASFNNTVTEINSTSRLVIPFCLLAATLIATNSINFKGKTPIWKPLSDFPVSMGTWNGKSSPMDQASLDTLKLSDYVIVDYVNENGRAVNLYTAWYASQTKGKSIHTPATCLPGNGWTFEESGIVKIPVGEGRSIPVNRAFMEKNGQRQLIYYWFPQRGRILSNVLVLKFFVFWDSITQQRSDGALVRVITPVTSSEKPADAEARLQSFVKQAVPVLDTFIPGKTLK